jgi:hypothetical protein
VALADAAGFEWISALSNEILVAFPTDETGRTVVFDVETLERLDDHPLSGRALMQAAMSGDDRTAVGIRFDGQKERIDHENGRTTDLFGSVDPAGIQRPIALDDDGRVAVTIDRRGVVEVWSVGDDEPVAKAQGYIGLPRWLDERRASHVSSVIAPDASRVALRIAATPTTDTRWEIIETNVEAWLSDLDQ